jgi:hypothetical protein
MLLVMPEGFAAWDARRKSDFSCLAALARRNDKILGKPGTPVQPQKM